MTEATALAPTALDAAKAVRLGLIVDACYDMHADHPSDLRPPVPASILAEYTLVGWVQMQDFFLGEGPFVFYGLLLRHKSNPAAAVLAIRGTVGFDEWYADFRSIVPLDWDGPGQVGDGFERIYRTMRIVKPTDPVTTETPGARSLSEPVPFEAQVAAALGHQHAGTTRSEIEAPLISTVDVVGHSLGSALATLYVAKNAKHNSLGTPLLCTFASPRVGDAAFANWFNKLAVVSWRITNDLDIVTKVPLIDFQHIEQLYEYNSGFSTLPSPACFHNIDTYLHLLDPHRAVSPGCQWSSIASARRLEMPSAAPQPRDIELALPNEKGTTINISIKIG